MVAELFCVDVCGFVFELFLGERGKDMGQVESIYWL